MISYPVTVSAVRLDIHTPIRSDATLEFERVTGGDIWINVRWGYPDERHRELFVIPRDETRSLAGLADLIYDDPEPPGGPSGAAP